MTGTTKPLNWDGFGDDTLREHEAWLQDAWSAAIDTLAKRDTIKRGMMGKPLLSPILRIDEEDADIIGQKVLAALRSGELIAYAIHPQTNEKHIVEVSRWWSPHAELLGHHSKVPDTMYEGFGPFVNRSLRLEAHRFYVWMDSACLGRGMTFKPRGLEGFEHVPVPQIYTKSLADIERLTKGNSRVSKEVPRGFVGIGEIFARALLALFPEQYDRSDWVSQPTRGGTGKELVPPPGLVETWTTRITHTFGRVPMAADRWYDLIVRETAYRLYRTANKTNTKVYYNDTTQKRDFVFPTEALDPLLQNEVWGAPWSGGEFVDIFSETEFSHLDGAVCFISEADEMELWEAFETDYELRPFEQKVTPKRRGPKPGGGYKKLDRLLFSEMEKLLRSGDALTPHGAAVLLGGRIVGQGIESNRVKRLSTLYRKETPDWEKHLSV